MWVWQGRYMQGSHTDDRCLGSALLFNPTQTHTKLSTSLQDGVEVLHYWPTFFFFLTLCHANTTQQASVLIQHQTLQSWSHWELVSVRGTDRKVDPCTLVRWTPSDLKRDCQNWLNRRARGKWASCCISALKWFKYRETYCRIGVVVKSRNNF